MSEQLAGLNPGLHSEPDADLNAAVRSLRISEYHAAPVEVVSSPVVDAAVIEGRSRGYVDGLKAAQEHADALEDTRRTEHERLVRSTRERTEQTLASLGHAAAQLTASMEHALDRAEETVFEIACHVAEVILGAELSDASVAARAAIHRALTASTPSPVHTIRLHPEAERAATAAAQLPAGVVLQADPTLPPGGAVALYRDGWLEAGVEDALGRVRAYATEENQR